MDFSVLGVLEEVWLAAVSLLGTEELTKIGRFASVHGFTAFSLRSVATLFPCNGEGVPS